MLTLCEDMRDMHGHYEHWTVYTVCERHGHMNVEQLNERQVTSCLQMSELYITSE